jgi:hypothetical protein
LRPKSIVPTIRNGILDNADALGYEAPDPLALSSASNNGSHLGDGPGFRAPSSWAGPPFREPVRCILRMIAEFRVRAARLRI